MPTVQYLEVPVTELRPNPFNPNRVSADNERKIRKSIERNGLFKPIIVRQVPGVAGYEIIGGQHRWEQAKELGHATIPIANLGEIDDARAKEICVIDNARYGSDDTLTLSEILKDIGEMEDLQEFLPYGDTDLAAIFSATSIDLDALSLPEHLEKEPEKTEDDAPAARVAATHTIMRFKIAIADAERMTALIARTQRTHDFRHEDALTNAGDALVHLLAAELAPGTAETAEEGWDDMLKEIEEAQQEIQE